MSIKYISAICCYRDERGQYQTRIKLQSLGKKDTI